MDIENLAQRSSKPGSTLKGQTNALYDRQLALQRTKSEALMDSVVHDKDTQLNENRQYIGASSPLKSQALSSLSRHSSTMNQKPS